MAAKRKIHFLKLQPDIFPDFTPCGLKFVLDNIGWSYTDKISEVTCNTCNRLINKGGNDMPEELKTPKVPAYSADLKDSDDPLEKFVYEHAPAMNPEDNAQFMHDLQSLVDVMYEAGVLFGRGE